MKKPYTTEEIGEILRNAEEIQIKMEGSKYTAKEFYNLDEEHRHIVNKYHLQMMSELHPWNIIDIADECQCDTCDLCARLGDGACKPEFNKNRNETIVKITLKIAKIRFKITQLRIKRLNKKLGMIERKKKQLFMKVNDTHPGENHD